MLYTGLVWSGVFKMRVPRAYYCKGSYFKCSSSLLRLDHLVYPLPSDGGLGVHATIDVVGAVKFGPNTEWLKEQQQPQQQPPQQRSREGEWEHLLGPPSGVSMYSVDETLRDTFIREINKYLPIVQADWIQPDYAGIRPKLIAPSSASDSHNNNSNNRIDSFGRDLSDFIVEGPQQHGLPGLVNLYGIESPGLTSSLAIGEYVANMVTNKQQ